MEHLAEMRKDIRTMAVKMGDIHAALDGLKQEVKGMGEKISSQNGRIGKLEDEVKINVTADAIISQKLEDHIKHDEKEFSRFSKVQEQMTEKQDELRSVVWKAAGAVAIIVPILATLWPYIPKLLLP